jgi:hypothetical protein
MTKITSPWRPPVAAPERRRADAGRPDWNRGSGGALGSGASTRVATDVGRGDARGVHLVLPVVTVVVPGYGNAITHAHGATSALEP